MNPLKFVCLAFTRGFRQVCAIPKTITSATRQRRRQKILDLHEAERLDRIRNLSKYLGK
jgi:hypothetical protein